MKTTIKILCDCKKYKSIIINFIMFLILVVFGTFLLEKDEVISFIFFREEQLFMGIFCVFSAIVFAIVFALQILSEIEKNKKGSK